MPDTFRPILLALPDDPEVLAEIGRIAVRHGQLDNILRLTLGDLANTNRRDTLDATARIGSAALRKRIRDLALKRLSDGEAFVRLEAILARAERATDRRNEILHSVWGKELDGESVVRDDTHAFNRAPTVEELRRAAADIEQITREIIFARHEGFLKAALQVGVKAKS